MANTSNKSVKRYPRRKRIRLPQADYQIQGAWYFVTICCHRKRPLMQEAVIRNRVQSILIEVSLSCRVEVAAYSVLPNHLHIVCSSGRKGLVDFVKTFKSKTTRAIRGSWDKKFEWQKSFFDHKIRSDSSLGAKTNYVLQNPVRLGLCKDPNEYRWNGRPLSDR